MSEWDTEPNRKHWIDEATGLDCLIVRNNLFDKGALCGYVGIPPNHPWFGKDYDDDEIYAEVHGGLTFAGACSGKICHGENGEKVANKEVWWFGFDCAHAGDYIPGSEKYYKLSFPETYRNITYVEAQCRSLASQIAKAS